MWSSSSSSSLGEPRSHEVHLYPYKSHMGDRGGSSSGSSDSKIVHVIRHAEGFHNVNESYRQIENLDARLTPKGIEQCKALATKITQANGCPLEDLSKNLELIITSPLTRCIDTALLSLEPVIAKRQPLIVAHEAIRETVNFNCDRRRPVSHVEREYPNIDFGAIETDHDNVWATFVEQLGCDKTWTECRDSAALHGVADRGRTFFEWLRARPEKHVAICTHSAFLRCILNFGYDHINGSGMAFQPPQVLDTRDADAMDVPVVRYGGSRSEGHAELQADYANCELRSMVVRFERIDSTSK